MWRDWLREGMPSESAVEWQASGSLLLATNPAQLADRQRLLESVGVHAELWDAGRLHLEEPALAPSISSGLYVSSDSQLVSVHVLSQEEDRPKAYYISTNSYADMRAGLERQGCGQGAAGSV